MANLPAPPNALKLVPVVVSSKKYSSMSHSLVHPSKLRSVSLALLLVLCTVVNSSRELDQGHNTSSSNSSLHISKRRWCGEKLMDMVKKICNNCFRDHEEMHSSFKRAKDSYLNLLLHAQSSGPKQRGVINRRSKRFFSPPPSRRGIVEKCCESTCTHADLMNYCCKEIRDSFQ